MTPKNRLALGSLTLLCLVATAAAQFEINPDHSDQPSAPEAAKASPQRVEITAKIAEQQKILEGCQAQIRAKSLEVETTLQDLIANGNEAGQAEALWIREKELENLRKRLASEIRSAEATLAALENRLGSLTTPAPEPAPNTMRPHAARVQQKQRPGAPLRASIRVGR